jgi:UDP-N-acetylglucosamine/UDP-N-acetylgalactosamine diphosphorylase
MRGRGVRYLHVFGVDNALVRPADPVFVGYCIRRGADVGCKVVDKLHPHEPVGVMACRREKGKGAVVPCVVEYSEITSEMAELTLEGPGRQLAYGAANIASHFFSLDFVQNTLLPNLTGMFHVARKRIPRFDASAGASVKPTEPNGIKLEAFVFDAFGLLDGRPGGMAVLQVPREEEFAPVKNASGPDSPASARAMVSELSKRWIRSAGGRLVDAAGEGLTGEEAAAVEGEGPVQMLCEVVPATSYAGEGLEEIVRSRGGTIVCPFLL